MFLQGVSPSLATELCHRAGLDPSLSSPALGEAEWQALHREWTAWLLALREGQFSAARSPGGRRYSVIGTWGAAGAASPLEVVDDYYRNLQVRPKLGLPTPLCTQ
jgi:predicted ribosome quality control (RQC) complex YloA/Tae2 family protein